MNIKGIGASKGVAISKIFKIEELPVEITQKTNDVQGELNLYQEAREKVVAKIQQTKKLAQDPEHAAIFEAHIGFVNDPFAIETIENNIKNNSETAEYAVKEFYTSFASTFEMMDDEYMRERAADIKDVLKKLLYVLNGLEEPDLANISEEVVIVAQDLSPSQTVQLNKEFVKGFVTNIGGPTSHTAIMARSLGIPSVVGAAGVMEHAMHGDLITLDGATGEVILNPNQEETQKFQVAKEKYLNYLAMLTKLKGQESKTLDGKHVELAANIGTPKDLPGVIDNDAEGIGLFRSEFLYMDNANWPTEEEQFNAYKAVVEGMKGKRVVIRTLDIGGDKTLKYFKFPEEMNPFLGYRAIRFCLQNLDIFKTQLRALIRASEFGKVAIMFPMITNVREFLDAKEVFIKCYNELKDQYPNIKPIYDIEVGLMIETPAAAILADKFSEHADFVSIGTNDLIQYSMAADRMNENISYLYQPLNPSVLRLISHVIKGAHKNGKWAGMCGEMAGDKRAIPLLVGLGLDEFSMSASSVLDARDLINNLNYEQMKDLANRALDLSTQDEVLALLNEELV